MMKHFRDRFAYGVYLVNKSLGIHAYSLSALPFVSLRRFRKNARCSPGGERSNTIPSTFNVMNNLF